MHRIVALLLTAVVASASLAGEALPVGWRGDGTGRYPQANPPTHWGRVAKGVKALFAQAGKPKTAETVPATDQAIPDGVIHRWLVLGTIPLAEGKKFEEDSLADEANLSADENDKAGDLSWKVLTADTHCLDLASFFALPAKAPPLIAYAQAWVYSPDAQTLVMNLMYAGQTRLWLNGKVAHAPPKGGNAAARVKLSLLKGWNRLLFKTLSGGASWYIRPVLFGADGCDFDSQNIVWTTRLPASGSSAPVIVSDKVFVTAESGALCCINKADGKLLWVRSNTYYDAASDDEKKANAAAFTELDALAAQLKQQDETALTVPPTSKTLEERAKLEDKLLKGMAKIDPRYKLAPRGEAGFTAPAPVTDGEHIYVTFGSGVTVCYDVQGNRKWLSLESHPDLEHGYTACPLLVDGKLLIYMGDLRALDAKTGKVVWERPRFLPNNGSRTYYHFHGSGCVLSSGDTKVACFPNGELVRISDGKTLFADFWKMGNARVATPVVDGGIGYKIRQQDGGALIFKLSAITDDKLQPEIIRTVNYDTTRFPKFYSAWHNASPLYHEGLLYCLNEDGVLTVIDTEKGEVVYQKLLDLDLYMTHNFGLGRGGAGASPTLAGKYIYLFGNQGTTLVIEPGRTYKQVAKNRLEQLAWAKHWREHQEITITCPVFEEKRLYYRAEENLYCIEQK